MNLDTNALFEAFAESGLRTKDILRKTKMSANTWLKARRGEPVSAQTAGRIAKVLGVPVKSLLPKE